MRTLVTVTRGCRVILHAAVMDVFTVRMRVVTTCLCPQLPGAGRFVGAAAVRWCRAAPGVACMRRDPQAGCETLATFLHSSSASGYPEPLFPDGEPAVGCISPGRGCCD